MRLTRKRRRLVLPSFPRWKFSFILILILFILCLCGGFLFADYRLRPTIQAKAEARARVVATTAINQAIQEKVAKNIHYEDLIAIKVDKDRKSVV
mgnify:FL=1